MGSVESSSADCTMCPRLQCLSWSIHHWGWYYRPVPLAITAAIISSWKRHAVAPVLPSWWRPQPRRAAPTSGPRPGSPQHSRITRRRRPLAPAAVGDLNDVDAARRPACTRKRQPRHAHRPRRRRPVTPAPARCPRRDGDLGCTDPLEARLAHSARGGPRPRYLCSRLRRARRTRRPAVCVARCRSPAHGREGARRPGRLVEPPRVWHGGDGQRRH